MYALESFWLFVHCFIYSFKIYSFDQTPANNRNMKLELWQSGTLKSTVILKYFSQGDTRKQGYSATVIPGLDHEYRLSMDDGGYIPADWIIEFSDPVFSNRWRKDEIYLKVAGRNCPSPVNAYHDRRYIWSGDNFLKVRGRGACTSYPDMEPVNCRTQAPISLAESCPGKCQRICNNGYCDCETGECLCNPGFIGTDCQINTCTAAGCVNGNCAAKYLGGELPVTNKPCVCIDGWFGDKCDSRTPPDLPEYVPNCHNGCFYYPDSDIDGGNLAVTSGDIKSCCEACTANPSCNSYVMLGQTCYLKSGTKRIYRAGIASGIRCSPGETASPIQPTIATTAGATLPTTVQTTFVATILPSGDICFNGYQFYPDTDISGGILQILGTQNSNYMTCVTECDKNSTCASWVLYGNTCYLKTTKTRVSNAARLAGIKCDDAITTAATTNAAATTTQDSSVVCQSDGCQSFANSDIEGVNLQSFAATSQSSCCVACNKNSQCSSWVYWAGACYLKAGTNRISKTGCFSGIK